MARRDDDEADEPAKKKEKLHSPALIWCLLLTICWGGVFGVYFIAKLVQTTQFLLALNVESRQQRAVTSELTRGGVITLIVLYSFLLVFALLTFIGGIGLVRRGGFGATLAMYCPGAAVLFALGGVVAEIFFIRGSSQFVMHLLGLLLTFVLGLALCVFNCWVLNDRKNTKVLK